MNNFMPKVRNAHTVGKLFQCTQIPKFIQNKTGNLNRLVTRKETELAIKKVEFYPNDFTV